MPTKPDAPTVVAGGECHNCVHAHSQGQAQTLEDIAAWIELMRDDAGANGEWTTFLHHLANDVRSMEWLRYLRSRRP